MIRADRFSVWFSGVAVGVALLVASGAVWPGADLLALAFPIVIAAGLAGCLWTALRVRGGWRWAVAPAFFLCGAAWYVTPTGTAPCDPRHGVLRIVSFNLWSANRSPQASADWIRAQHPDAVIVLEAKGRGAAVVRILQWDFPYQTRCHPHVPCSTLILSRHNPVAIAQLGKGDVENRKGLSALIVRLPLRRGFATIAAVHLSWPLPLERQGQELARLQQALSDFGHPAEWVVAGDFNMTTAMPLLRRFIAASGLRPLPTGPTWPSQPAWLPPLIAIDNILASQGWSGQARRGPSLGSDHRPVSAMLCPA